MMVSPAKRGFFAACSVHLMFALHMISAVQNRSTVSVCVCPPHSLLIALIALSVAHVRALRPLHDIAPQACLVVACPSA